MGKMSLDCLVCLSSDVCIALLFSIELFKLLEAELVVVDDKQAFSSELAE